MSTTVANGGNRFALGDLVATPAAISQFPPDVIGTCIARHRNGDWGDLQDADKQANEDALRTGARLFSSYQLPQGTLWIITEALNEHNQRWLTTVLLPEDY